MLKVTVLELGTAPPVGTVTAPTVMWPVVQVLLV